MWVSSRLGASVRGWAVKLHTAAGRPPRPHCPWGVGATPLAQQDPVLLPAQSWSGAQPHRARWRSRGPGDRGQMGELDVWP